MLSTGINFKDEEEANKIFDRIPLFAFRRHTNFKDTVTSATLAWYQINMLQIVNFIYFFPKFLKIDKKEECRKF